MNIIDLVTPAPSPTHTLVDSDIDDLGTEVDSGEEDDEDAVRPQLPPQLGFDIELAALYRTSRERIMARKHAKTISRLQAAAQDARMEANVAAYIAQTTPKRSPQRNRASRAHAAALAADARLRVAQRDFADWQKYGSLGAAAHGVDAAITGKRRDRNAFESEDARSWAYREDFLAPIRARQAAEAHRLMLAESQKKAASAARKQVRESNAARKLREKQEADEAKRLFAIRQARKERQDLEILQSLKKRPV